MSPEIDASIGYRTPHDPCLPGLAWPELRVQVVVNVEHYEFQPPPDRYRAAFPRVPAPPDVTGYSMREYGNRRGIWRLFDVLDRHRIPVTCSLNADVLTLFPDIAEALVERDWCPMLHGTMNTRYLFGLDEPDERALIESGIETIDRHYGRPPLGMLGPGFSGTPSTFRIMVEAGLRYSMDWFVDERPFRIDTSVGDLLGIPYTRELNDAVQMYGWPLHTLGAEDYGDRCVEQVLAMTAAPEPGRVATIALHPYLIGLPQHIGVLDRVLERLTAEPGITFVQPDRIVHELDEGER